MQERTLMFTITLDDGQTDITIGDGLTKAYPERALNHDLLVSALAGRVMLDLTSMLVEGIVDGTTAGWVIRSQDSAIPSDGPQLMVRLMGAETPAAGFTVRAGAAVAGFTDNEVLVAAHEQLIEVGQRLLVAGVASAEED